MSRSARILAFSLSLLALVACVAQPPKPGEVAREWSRTFRQLQINPIFPPREDVQVGDVYVRPFDPSLRVLEESETSFLPIGVLATHVDVTQQLAAYYGQRHDFPATPGATPAADPLQVPTGNSSVFASRDDRRLRQVAFPDFLSMSLESGDLRGLIPVEGLEVTLGASWQSNQQVTVKIPSAESYGLPALEMLRAVLEPNTKKLRSDLFAPTLLQLLQAGQRAWIQTTPDLDAETRARLLDDPALYLELLTEVYYARTFDIGISATSGRAFGAGASTPGAGAGSAASGADSGTATPSSADPALAQEGLEQHLREKLAQIGDQSMPGGALELLSASSRHIAMRRTYAKPIAIGHRGLVLRVGADGELLGVSASMDGQATPTSGDAASARGKLAEAINAWLAGQYPGLTPRPRFEATDDERLTFTFEPIAGLTLDEARARVRENATAIAAAVKLGELHPTAAEPVLQAFRDGNWDLVLLD